MKILLTLSLLIITGCSSYDYVKPTNKKHHEIIQLVGLNGGGASCSAFVISNKIALTAGHCLVDNKTCDNFGNCDFITHKIIIANSLGQDTGVRASLVYAKKEVSPNADCAILNGNFKDFNKIPFQSHIFTLEKGDKLIHCGYPNGKRPPTCTSGEYLGGIEFTGKSNAFIIEGMSGGPVINKYGIAVGINSARGRNNDNTYFQPLFGLIKTKN